MGWWSVFRLLPRLAGLSSAMAIAPPFVRPRPPSSFDPPWPSRSLPAAWRAWDLFGSRRSAWNDGTALAWDCFGFHIWPRWNAVNVAVLRQSSTGRRPSWTLTKGVVTEVHGSTDPYVIVRTAPRRCAVSGFGVEFVASVRAVQHWVIRWRRGLRRLRRENARMVLAHKLPGLPALVQHVQSFL